jgi:hypothetical protein
MVSNTAEMCKKAAVQIKDGKARASGLNVQSSNGTPGIDVNKLKNYAGAMK